MVPLCTQLDFMVVFGQFFFLLSVQVALKKKKKKKLKIRAVGSGDTPMLTGMVPMRLLSSSIGPLL